MEETKNQYQVKLSVLLNSVNYCSDVETDGYYVVKEFRMRRMPENWLS